MTPSFLPEDSLLIVVTCELPCTDILVHHKQYRRGVDATEFHPDFTLGIVKELVEAQVMEGRRISLLTVAENVDVPTLEKFK